jgi:two-component system cell cycle response regulator DivK
MSKLPLILVVDDDHDSREMLVQYLSFRGFSVITATDGDAGFNAALEHLPNVILMDRAMPVMDGLESTRRIKAHPRTRKIPVLALSAHAYEHERHAAAAAGCDGYVTKPVNLRQLAATLVRLLSGGVAALPDSVRVNPAR